MTAHSPYVAWGLRAMTVAYKARSGRKVAFPEICDLARMHTDVLPEDGEAARALTRFIARWSEDPVAAGAGLLVFLQCWREGEIAPEVRRTGEVLAETSAPDRAADPPPAADKSPPPAPPPLFAWQSRADAGLD
ncbi:hypothetical protein HKCCE4037_06520 [Rhodobacterales bacterium HKCCE4037]|nr:hypothetical protein [Rhodobacterales bacterium HKCCE4037]